MKVQLNSDPSYFPKALEGIEKGFGLYSVGDTVFNGKDKKTQFASDLVQKINSFISKVPGVKLKEESKVFLDRNAENIKYLKENTLAIFTKNLLIQLNVDSIPNKVIKSLYKSIGDPDNSVRTDEIINSLSNDRNYMFSYETNEGDLGLLQRGSLVVSANVKDPFFQNMITKVGIEKTFDFVFFHEAAHHMEIFATKEFKNSENKDIVTFLNKTINSQSVYFGDSVDPTIFAPIRQNIAVSLESLKKEIYADTVSILLLRNRDISQGRLGKVEVLNLVSSVSETRANCHEMILKDVDPNLSYFTHSTSIAMDYLHEKIQSLGDTEMTMQDMDIFAKDVQSVALARTIINLKLTSDDFIHQLNSIVCVNFSTETGTPYLEVENRSEKFIEQMQKLKLVAGESWVTSLEDRVGSLKKESPYSIVTDFNIGFEKQVVELEYPDQLTPTKNISPDLSVSKVYDVASIEKTESYIDPTKLPDASNSIANMLAARTKFLSTSKPNQSLTNNK